MADPVERSPRRALPSTDLILRQPVMADLLADFDRTAVTRLVRRALDSHRAAARLGVSPPSAAAIAAEVRALADRVAIAGPRPVVNATGVVLHTNLGRAPLSSAAVAAMVAAAGACDLELDLGSGGRGSRHDHVTTALIGLTGADAATTTGNAASAMLLALASLARRREVIVSRGQLVEIGGGFRVPVILRQSGARLVEVGTTNRTRLQDYEEAMSARTAAILHVHASNFRMSGFTEEVGLEDLARLAHAKNVPLIADNGSGALLDTARFGLRHEPTPTEAIAVGADVVAFSADKLLGGPQAGLLIGRADLIERARRHPLARALRPDKLILAALAATLQSYLRGTAEQDVPIWRMIAATREDIAVRAERVRAACLAEGLSLDVIAGESTIGGGSLPEETLPTVLLRLPAALRAEHLRRLEPPIMGRTRDGRVELDLRTVPEDADRDIAHVLPALFAALTT